MKSIYLSGLMLFLLISCGKENEAVEVPAGFNSKVLVEIMKNPQSVSKEEIAKIAGTEADKIKIYNEWFSPEISKRTVLYSWPNGGNKTIRTRSGKELKLDAYSSLGIGLIKRISKENFQKQFESKEFIQHEINRIANDESIDADLAIYEAKHLAENAKIQKFKKMDKVGDAAYWETPVHALHVFANGIAFTVTTNMEGESTSRQAALKMVKLIMNQ